MGDVLPEGILEDMVDAIPTLLRRMRHLAETPGRVLPDTTRQILAFMFGSLYTEDHSLNLKGKDGEVAEETFAIKMAQMQRHFRIMVNDAVFEVGKAMARETCSPSSFASGASWEELSIGTVNGKLILSPHPDALANVVVMRAMGRDVMAHIKEELHKKGGALANQHPLDFLPAVAFVWSRNGTESSIAFTGMAGPATFEFKDLRDANLMMRDRREETAPKEPSMLQGQPISVLGDGVGEHSHWQCVSLLGLEPIPPILSQLRNRLLFPDPFKDIRT